MHHPHADQHHLLILPAALMAALLAAAGVVGTLLP